MARELNAYKIRFNLLEVGSVSETMETLDKKFPYDIMAMVRRKKIFLERLFIKSFTQNMAYVTKKPLLVIPEKVSFEETENRFKKEELRYKTK